jgi:4-hydroxy-3-methylbut-2-enyl diphosphate reductase
MKPSKEYILASPRGFCAGVDRAIAIVERALELFGAPIYVRHEVVHNQFVVNGLRNKGSIFVDELDEIPEGSTVIFSAHGVPRSVEEQAANRELQIFDATCPLVTKVHLEVVRHSRNGLDIVLIGHRGHPEVEGTMGRFAGTGTIHLVENADEIESLLINNPKGCAYVTQTTLSMDDSQAVIAALKHKYPQIHSPKKDDICYATQNRQDEVKTLAKICDLIFVVGSPNSSNSNRLREVAERDGVKAYLIDRADEIDVAALSKAQMIGVTAGASAPDELVEEVCHLLEKHGFSQAHHQQKIEEVYFPLPKRLQ